MTKETELDNEKPISTITQTKNISNNKLTQIELDDKPYRTELLIVNMNKLYLHAGYFFAIRIFSNGKTYAGLIDENLNFQGCGVYISKSGNVISGIFQDNDIRYGKCLSFKFSSMYEGQFENMKKHGVGEEDADKYEFSGEFSKGKKIKGKYTVKDSKENKGNKGNSQVSKGYKVLSIDIDRKILGNKVRALIKNQDSTTFSYFGSIKDGKFYDETAQLLFDIENPFPRYEGGIVGNYKTGKGKYIWNDKMSVKGQFKVNKLDSFLNQADLNKFLENTSENQLDKPGLEKAELNYINQQFDAVFSKGVLLYFKEKEEVI